MRSNLFKMTRAAVLATAMVFTFSCSNDDNDGNNPSSGSGDKGNDIANYKTKQIGDQVWMAENLNYAVEGSKCYNDDPANCDKYGRLYDWVTAKTVCPKGWHLPSNAEWTTLTNFAGGESTAGTKLKATNGWDEGGNGTDEFSFSAFPGGYRRKDGSFDNVGKNGSWWSATEGTTSSAWYIEMNYDFAGTGTDRHDKIRLLSVRCVQD